MKVEGGRSQSRRQAPRDFAETISHPQEKINVSPSDSGYPSRRKAWTHGRSAELERQFRRPRVLKDGGCRYLLAEVLRS